jgi:hypothetical protein
MIKRPDLLHLNPTLESERSVLASVWLLLMRGVPGRSASGSWLLLLMWRGLEKLNSKHAGASLGGVQLKGKDEYKDKRRERKRTGRRRSRRGTLCGDSLQ